MFKFARIKLTAMYLLIIMVITLVFSSLVYINVNRYTQRALVMHDRRIESSLREFRSMPNFPKHFQAPYTNEASEQVRKNTILLLVTLNTGILILSGIVSYWFAGITLKPIEEMTNKQKKFIADAAHELKTPLTVMKTQLEVNKRNKKLNLQGAKKLIDSTIDEVDSLTLLTNSLLKQSKYESNTNTKNYEAFEIKGLVTQVIKKFEPEINTKNITLTVNIENIKIKAQKDSIAELLTIILDNAIKFNKKNGNIDINIKKTGKNICLKIKNTGDYILAKDLPHIFDRFYKVDSSRTNSNQNGFGLGLSIAKGIVKAHKGKISVTSQKNKGTIFTIKLPLNI